MRRPKPITKRQKNVPTHVLKWPEHHLFEAIRRYLVEEQQPIDIAKWMRRKGFKCSTQDIRYAVVYAYQLGIIKFSPPEKSKLRTTLKTKYAHLRDVRVMSLGHPQGPPQSAGEKERFHQLSDMVAAEAAGMVLKWVSDGGRDQELFRIAIGGGGSAQRFAWHFARLLESAPKGSVPSLRLHSLSSGYDTNNPMRSPGAFCSYYDEIEHHDIGFVLISAPAVVPCGSYETFASCPEIKAALAFKDTIDIVVTSFASAADTHSLYSRFLALNPDERDRRRVFEMLEKHKFAGDVQFRPYSSDGHAITFDTGVRSINLFELSELARMVREGKRVLGLCAPCHDCGWSKAEALRPLLDYPDIRVFSDIVTDAPTARILVPKRDTGGTPTGPSGAPAPAPPENVVPVAMIHTARRRNAG